MSDDKAYAATPAETLEQHIMDVNIAKSEAEWWACRTIEALRAENARLLKWKEEDTAAMRVFERYRELEAEIARLRDLIKRLANTIEFLNSTHNAGEGEDIVSEARKELGESDGS